MSDKEKLEQLEKEAVDLQNKRITFIESYIIAQKNNNVLDQIEIEETWNKLSEQIKSINKRIVLLKILMARKDKYQSNELNNKPIDKLFNDLNNIIQWKLIEKTVGVNGIEIIPTYEQFSQAEIRLLIALADKYRVKQFCIDSIDGILMATMYLDE